MYMTMPTTDTSVTTCAGNQQYDLPVRAGCRVQNNSISSATIGEVGTPMSPITAQHLKTSEWGHTQSCVEP